MSSTDIPMLIIAAVILVAASGCFAAIIQTVGELKARVAKHNADLDEAFRRLGRLEQAGNASAALRQHLNAQARLGMLGLGKADEGKPQ